MLVLIGAEILRVYLIMPFPGSQRMNSIDVAYALHQYGVLLQLLALAACVPLLVVKRSMVKRALLTVPFLIWGGIFYFTHFVASADQMFKQPTQVVMATPDKNTVPLERVVLGIGSGSEWRAYPVELIGYHHQVRDLIAGIPVMITYCTVCRTGAVYGPVSDEFRLVGMDHFNAMFEDAKTGSWWRQVSGRAIAGPRTGERLAYFPSEQMTLDAWYARHPSSLVLQPDVTFNAEYQALRGFDDGTRPGSLTGRNAESWKEKSWVVGVVAGEKSRVFDWNELIRAGTINAEVGTVPVVVWVALDGKSFGARERMVDGRVLTFSPHTVPIVDGTGTREVRILFDAETRTTWTLDGACINPECSGKRLKPVESHQEFWHAWREFHPETEGAPQP